VHTVDVIAVCVAVLLVIACAAVLARQRYMLRVAGAIPLAVHAHGNRWLYGVARYLGGELRWYRSLGIATRPSRIWRRDALQIVSHRSPRESELGSLPATAIVVECRHRGAVIHLALGEGAYTGFVSWVEASAPRS
jgi:hypothetical protein